MKLQSVTDSELLTFAEQIRRELEHSMGCGDEICDSLFFNFVEQIEISPPVERELKHSMSAGDNDSSEIMRLSR